MLEFQRLESISVGLHYDAERSPTNTFDSHAGNFMDFLTISEPFVIGFAREMKVTMSASHPKQPYVLVWLCLIFDVFSFKQSHSTSEAHWNGNCGLPEDQQRLFMLRLFQDDSNEDSVTQAMEDLTT